MWSLVVFVLKDDTTKNLLLPPFLKFYPFIHQTGSVGIGEGHGGEEEEADTQVDSGLSVTCAGVEVSPGGEGHTEWGVDAPEESKRAPQLDLVFCFEGRREAHKVRSRERHVHSRSNVIRGTIVTSVCEVLAVCQACFPGLHLCFSPHCNRMR